jgi:hypothetical protein
MRERLVTSIGSILTALVSLLAAHSAAAASSSCRDLLVTVPATTYACHFSFVETGSGPPFPVSSGDLKIQFLDESPADPASFTMKSVTNGAEHPCVCDPRGTAAKPSFFSARTFTCQDELGYVYQGLVTGGRVKKIRDFVIQRPRSQANGGTEANIGSCEALP